MDDAERHFDIKYFDDEFPLVVNTSNSTPKTGQACPMSANLSPIFEHSPTTEKVVAADTNGHAMKSIITLFGQLSSMQQEQLLSRLLRQYMGTMTSRYTSSLFLPQDAVGVIANAMKNLQDNDKPNLIYHLGKCLASDKEGKSTLPMDRMPYGLLSHNIMFFSSEDVTNLHPEPHFVEWEISMFSHFGHKWAALQRGPMWSECDVKELPMPTMNVVLPIIEELDSRESGTTSEELSSQDPSASNLCENNIIHQALVETFGEDLQNCVVVEDNLPNTCE